MNPSALQRWVDELLASSAQQWVIRLLSIAAALGAMAAAGVASDGGWPFGLVLVGALAAASAVRPDTHAGLLVVAVVSWHWMATVDGVVSAWLPVAAVSLLVFHTATALAASVPNGGVVPTIVVARWAWRAAMVAVGVVALWALVVVFDGRDAAGNGALTAVALVIVAATAAFVRSRSLTR